MTLDDIEKLIAAASPGPWLYNGAGGYVAFFAVTNERIADYISAPNSAGLNPSAPDAAFIAAARTLMPRLLRVVREAETTIQQASFAPGYDAYEAAMKALVEP